jgi:hypothetical protein
MKATVTFEFGGCYNGCPYCRDFGVMSPAYCHHPVLPEPKKIIGYSSKSCEIPAGKEHPDWCPVAKEGKKV